MAEMDLTCKLIDRFWSYVHKPSDDECWLWTRAISRHGYGRFNCNGRTVQSHRFAYITTVGPIPHGLHLRHTCDNPPCVNPKHLVPCTQAENVADMMAKGRDMGPNRRSTFCIKGQPLNGDNLLISGRRRRCRKCRHAIQQRYERKKRHAITSPITSQLDDPSGRSVTDDKVGEALAEIS